MNNFYLLVLRTRHIIKKILRIYTIRIWCRVENIFEVR